LIRAVLGSRVLALLTAYCEQTDFFAPDTAFDEAAEHLPAILEKRGINAASAMAVLDALKEVVQKVERETYGSFESVARDRLIHRHQDDWPILAAALALRCPIWTEDTDFFGCGVPTWTTDRVEIYLKLPLAPASD
jgi:predicted nucleic acid-binding protein